jgi:hypothetical protein
MKSAKNMLLQASAYLQDSRPKPLLWNGEIVSEESDTSPLLLKQAFDENVFAQ